MLTSLNPRISLALAGASFILFLYVLVYDVNAMLGFFSGIILIYPLVYEVWKSITGNWKKVFKPFYSKKFYKRRMKIIRSSWKLTWWIAPYCIIVYGTGTAMLMIYFNSMYVLHGFLLGSVFEIFWFVHMNSQKYYKQLPK